MELKDHVRLIISFFIWKFSTRCFNSSIFLNNYLKVFCYLKQNFATKRTTTKFSNTTTKVKEKIRRTLCKFKYTLHIRWPIRRGVLMGSRCHTCVQLSLACYEIGEVMEELISSVKFNRGARYEQGKIQL